MNGEVYIVFMDIVKELINWQKDYRRLGEEFDTVVNRFNAYLRHNTHVLPVKNIRGFLKCLKDNSLEELGFFLSEDDRNLSIIDEDGKITLEIMSWYESSLKEDDVDQDLIRQFLMKCRAEYSQTEDRRFIDMYAEVRAFVNPNNYLITNETIVTLISKYLDLSDTILMIKEWFEDFKPQDATIMACPICGKVVSNDIFEEYKCTEMCMYYRDKLSLKPKQISLDIKRKYKKLKRGIYIYTLLPGIAELRMYEKLKEEYGNENVILYPDIDKFDIAILSKTGKVYLDLKDFASPYSLIDTLVKNNSFIKMENINENDFVFLVIPNHRKVLYNSGDYKRIVKQRIGKISNKIEINYEKEMYRELRGILDEH